MSDILEQIEALRHEPDSADAAQALRMSCRAGGEFAVLARAFRERGQALNERGALPEAIAALLESAQIYEEDLRDSAAAVELYRDVLVLEEGNRRALFALGLLLHDLERYDELIALYRRRLERTQDEGEQTTFYLYLAEVLSDRLGDHGGAFEEVKRAARIAPRNLRIIDRLQQLGEWTGRQDEVAVIIGDLMLHQQDARVRAALSLRLAELYLGPLDRPERALAHYRSALLEDGGDPEVLVEVADAFRERRRFDELGDLLEATARDRRVGPHQARLERELARIYEIELHDHRRAVHALIRAARNSPDDRELHDELLRVGLLSGELERVAAAFEELAERVQNPLLRSYVGMKLGHLLEGELNRFADAARVYESILSGDPAHIEARRRLIAVYERLGKKAELLEHLVEGRKYAGLPEEARALLERERSLRLELGDEAGAAALERRIARGEVFDPGLEFGPQLGQGRPMTTRSPAGRGPASSGAEDDRAERSILWPRPVEDGLDDEVLPLTLRDRSSSAPQAPAQAEPHRHGRSKRKTSKKPGTEGEDESSRADAPMERPFLSTPPEEEAAQRPSWPPGTQLDTAERGALLRLAPLVEDLLETWVPPPPALSTRVEPEGSAAMVEAQQSVPPAGPRRRLPPRASVVPPPSGQLRPTRRPLRDRPSEPARRTTVAPSEEPESPKLPDPI